MYNVENGIDSYIPVDVYIPGCAASPELIIDGVVKALEILEKKTKNIEKPKKLLGKLDEKQETIDRTKFAGNINDS
jgi:NADH:ubiquinone oxidoreductase subunit B-like Fe-S oxidoreductase